MIKKDFNYSCLIGRTYEQVNCWQLVREFYLLVFNLELKNYVEYTPGREETASLIKTNVGDFHRVDGAPEFGDIVLLRVKGFDSHIGVYVGQEKFLHSSKTTGSVIEALSRWGTNVVGFYRHKESESK